MPKLRRRKGSRGRTFGTAMLLWNLWRRLPSSRRRQVLSLARKHGPKIARKAYKARRMAKKISR